MGGWLGLRAGLDDVERRKSCPNWDLTPTRRIIEILQLLTKFSINAHSVFKIVFSFSHI
jgi:hypothetical protein